MQAFGNLASPILRKTTKAGKAYAEFRLAESQRSQPGSASDKPTWYTVRVIQGNVPEFVKGDFIRVTGKLKCDFYMSREGKPTGSLLIIAFEAFKISKHAVETETQDTAKDKEQAPAMKVAPIQVAVPVSESTRVPKPPSQLREPVHQPDRMPTTASWADW